MDTRKRPLPVELRSISADASQGHSSWHRRPRVGAWLLFVLTASPGYGEIATDGMLGAAINLVGPNYMVTSDLGKQRGGNLFHSFQRFSIDTGESATFSGPADVARVISRVTGGTSSNINGVLRSTIDGADFYLLNPAGVAFGPDAELDVSGAFFTSTADSLRLADGGVFDATHPAASTLTVAAPAAFGFLGTNLRGIRLKGAAVSVQENQAAALVGGDIRLNNGATLRAPSGVIGVASVASEGEVQIGESGGFLDLSISPSTRQGDITISGNSSLSASGDGGGTLRIRGGQLVLDYSGMTASATGPTDGSLVSREGAGMDIRLTGKLLMRNWSALSSNVFHDVAHDSAGVRIHADEVELDRAQIDSVAFSGYTAGDGTVFNPSKGDGGDVEIVANELTLSNGAFIRVNTGGPGQGGDIRIQADHVQMLNDADIYTLTFGTATGDPGDIDIVADTVTLSNTAHSGVTILTSQSFTRGGTGAVRISTSRLSIQDEAFIASNTLGPGEGGEVIVQPRDQMLDVVIAGTGVSTTGIFANTLYDSGPGGTVTVDATSVRLEDSGSIQSGSFFGSTGPGGAVVLNTDELVLSGGFITSRSSGSGQAGDIFIDTDSLSAISGSISSTGEGTGAAGSIFIQSDAIGLAEGTQVNVSGDSGLGVANAGNIEIQANRLSLSGQSAPDGCCATGIFAVVRDGQAGRIRIQAEESVLLSDRAFVQASSTGRGPASSIEVEAPRIELRDGAEFVSNSFGSGPGGSISVAAGRLRVEGEHVNATDSSVTPSGIFTQTAGSGGAGGDIQVDAGLIEVRAGGRVDSSTVGAGDGGSIRIDAGRVFVAGSSQAQEAYLIEQGIDPEVAALSSRSSIASNSGQRIGESAATGVGGLIHVNADSIKVRDHGAIVSVTIGGEGGEIGLTANRIELSNDGLISAESLLGGGNAGTIGITATERFQAGDSAVRTAADLADGGDIDVTVERLVYLLRSDISTSVAGGEGAGGNIDIDPDFVVLNGGSITANAFGGPGGNIQIVAGQLFVDPTSLIQASSVLGIDGSINISAPDRDISNGLTALSKAFLDASALIQTSCAAGRTGVSSLAVMGRGGLPPDPHGYLSGVASVLGRVGNALSEKELGSRAAVVAH